MEEITFLFNEWQNMANLTETNQNVRKYKKDKTRVKFLQDVIFVEFWIIK